MFPSKSFTSIWKLSVIICLIYCISDRTGPNLPIMTEQMTFKGSLKGHNGWVTQIATTPIFPDMLLSSSRDKTIIMWHLTRDEGSYGTPKRRMQVKTFKITTYFLNPNDP